MSGHEKQQLAQIEPPKDRYDGFYWAVYFTGLVILLPWNILITVNGFWDYKFRNVTLDGVEMEDPPPLTQTQKEFTSYLSIAANVPNATALIMHALFGHRFSMRGRIIGSQLGQIVVFVLIVALAAVDSDSWQHTFMVLNLVVIALINLFCGVFQGSYCANLGTFPVRYMGSTINGAGMGGLLPSVVNVVILALNANFQQAGFWCFLFAEAMCILCLVLHLKMERTEFYKHYANSDEERKKQKSVFNFSEDLGIYKEIFRDAWVFILATFVNFMATLSVFPGVTVLIEPEEYTGSDWDKIYFVPVCCFIVFNLGDVVGKNLASWIQRPRTSVLGQAVLLGAALARLAFIPLFMFCNVSPGDRNTEVLFPSELYYLLFIVLLSVSNGYVGSISLMFGPKSVRPHLQEVTAAIQVAALVIGCGVGSVISTPVVKLL